MKAKKILAALISAVMAVQAVPMYVWAAEEKNSDVEPIEEEGGAEVFAEEESIIFDKKTLSETVILEEEWLPAEYEMEVVKEASTLYADAAVSGDFEYIVNEDGKTATIIGFVGEVSGDLMIPEKIDGYTVTSIGDGAFAYSYGFTGSLTLPDSLITVGNEAFLYCDGFTDGLILPDSLTSIGESAFAYCYGFTGSLILPDNLTSIGKAAFMCCPNIKEIIVDDKNEVYASEDGMLFNNDKTLLIVCPAGKEAIDYRVVESVITIDDYAFFDCDNLTGSLTLPAGLTLIGTGAFSGCQNLEGIIVDDKNGVYTSEDGILFNKDKTLLIVYPAGKKAVNYCFPKSVTAIEDAAFYECNGITGSLILPDNLISLGELAFAYCSGFTGSLILPDSLTSIKFGTFFGCFGFTGSLTLPVALTTIEDMAFLDCSGINIVYFSGDVPVTWGIDIFCDYEKNLTICYPEENTSGWTSPTWTAPDGIEYNTAVFIPGSVSSEVAFTYTVNDDGITATITGFVGEESGDLVIPEMINGYTVTVIGESAFEKSTGFTGSLTIPDSVTEIKNSAFYDCSGFTGSLKLPNSLITIGEWSFDGCSGFTGSLMIPESVVEIGRDAFYGCSGFTGSLTIPDSVSMIDSYTFAYCSGLEEIIIPATVDQIGNGAFSECGSLSKITFLGDAPSFGEPMYGPDVFNNTIATIYYPADNRTWQEGIFADYGGTITWVANGKTSDIAVVASGQCGDNITWTLYEDGLLVLAGLGRMWDYSDTNLLTDEQKEIAKTLKICGSIGYLEGNAFRNNNSIESVYLSAYVYMLGSTALAGCSNLKKIIVSDNNTCYYADEYGVLYNKEQTTLELCPAGFSEKEYTILDTGTFIAEYAFMDCVNLESIHFSSQLETIGAFAFEECDRITDLEFPDSLTELQVGAFQNCDGITSVNIPANLTIIDGAFDECINLEKYIVAADNPCYAADDDGVLYSSDFNTLIHYPAGKKQAAYEVCESTTIIDDFAFFEARNLVTVVLPENIVELKNRVFQNCVNLETLYFKGDVPVCGIHCFVCTHPGITVYYNDTKSGWTSPAWTTSSGETVNSAVGAVSDWQPYWRFDEETGTLTFKQTGNATGVYPTEETSLGKDYRSYREKVKRVVFEGGYLQVSSNMFNSFPLLESVVLSDSIRSIGELAFCGAYSLQVIEYPENSQLERIENEAFYGCKGLDSVQLPSSVEYIGENAFAKCTALKEITFPESLTEIEWGAFRGCTALCEIEFPGSVAKIAGGTFMDCSNLRTVSLQDGITEIGSNAFQNCINLESIYCSATLNTLGEEAFQGCTQLKTVDLSSTELENFEKNVFADCSALECIELPATLSIIGSSAFKNCTALSAIALSTSVQNIGSSAFENCTSLTDIDFSENLTYIGEAAFKNCTALSAIDLPASVQDIYSNAFENCTSLTDIDFSENLTYIGEAAFKNCTALSVIDLSTSVQEIDSSAFENCTSLTDIDFSRNLTYIGEAAFKNCTALSAIDLPASVQDIDSSAFKGCINIQAFSVDEANLFLYSDDYGVLMRYAVYEKGADSLISYPVKASVTEYTVPDQIVKIESYAFYGAENIQKVIFPGGFRVIRKSAFENCINLETAYFYGNAPTECGEKAFENTSENFVIQAALETSGWTSPEWISSAGDSYPTQVTNNFMYEVNSDTKTITVTGIKKENGYHLSIPSSIDGYTVTAIGDSAFIDKVGFTGSLTLPATLVSIGESAFANCTGFSGSLTIPDNVTMIGESAFSNCRGFTGSLTLSNSISTINNHTFERCGFKYQENLIIPDGVTTIGDYAFSGSGFRGGLVIPDSVITIGDYAFSDSGFGGNLIIPDSVTTIGDYAFRSCDFKGDLTIPGSVTIIGKYAFNECEHLTGDISIGDNVTTIGDYAFEGCTNISGNLKLGNSVTTIGNYAFSWCLELTGNMIIPDSVITIGDYAFEGCDFEGDLTIPGGVVTIGDYAFYQCDFTGNLIIGNSVTSIGDYAFYGCNQFTGIMKISNSVTSIGDYAFGNCKFTGDLVIPDSVIAIGDYAFSGCSGFNGNLMIGKNITSVGNYVFSGCTGFTGTLTIPGNVTMIGNHAFSGCYGFTGDLIIPGNVTMIGEYAFYNCEGMKGKLTLSDNITVISDYAFADCCFTGNLIIPDGVTTIGYHAFAFCEFSGILEFPDSTTEIKDYAFYYCEKLEQLLLNKNLQYIGRRAFNDCKSLKKVVMPEFENKDVYFGSYIFSGCVLLDIAAPIDSEITANIYYAWNNSYPMKNLYIFYDCTSLNKFYYYPDMLISKGSFENSNPDIQLIIVREITDVEGVTYNCDCTQLVSYPVNKTDKTYVIANTVTTISKQAFSDNPYLETIRISNCVETIEEYAFSNCVNLRKAYFLGDALQSWSQGIFDGVSEDFVICYYSDSSGWTSPTWTAPDGTVYKTEMVSLTGSTDEFMYSLNYSKTGLEITEYIGSSVNVIVPEEIEDHPVVSFSSSVFQENTKIQYVYLPDTIRAIPDWAFFSCTSLREIRLPSYIEGLYEGTFANCVRLEIIEIPKYAHFIGSSTFTNCQSLESIILPPVLQQINKSVFDGCTNLRSITLPKGISMIGRRAFYGCENLTSINIPEGVTMIANNAFNGCALEQIILPSTLERIDALAFNCSNLHSVYFMGDLPSEWGGWEHETAGYIQDTAIYSNTDLTLYYLETAKKWTSPTWTSPQRYRIDSYGRTEIGDGVVYNTAVFALEDLPDVSDITTTWDTSALTLAEGDTYAFSGKVSSTVPLDKLHISVVRADNTSVGIDYYREVEIGSTTFDLSTVPSITAGDLLNGLKVTNNQGELSLVSASYLIRMWITDTAGNYLDGLSKMITVTDVSAAPVVRMLPVTEITASTAKLQAQIVDARGGIIVDFGFNMYDTETGGERHAQYRAKQTDPKYQTDPYYQTAEYDPETGIFTVILKDHNPNRTYYAEGFAVYYQGDTPITGFTPERTGFTTSAAEISITSPEAYDVLASADVTVEGNIDCKIDGITFDDLLLTVYDYQMTEVMSVSGVVAEDNTFTAAIDLTDKYAGTYFITASVNASSGSSVVSAPVSFNIPGKLAVYTDPADESRITATQAVITGRVPDTMGETLVYYGFHIFDESGNPLGSYFDGHDDESRWTTDFEPATGVITGEIPAEPGTTLYYSAFASYKTGGVQIDSFASTRESFTTKCVDITLDKINSYDGLSYKLDETAPYIKFHGHISNIADGHTFGNPQLVVTDSKGKLIESAEVELNGNEFTAEFDMSAYEVGVYTITAQITDDTGRVSYSNIKMVEMPKKCTEIVFKTNLGGEILAQDEVHTIAHHYWLVVDAEIDTGRSDIVKIEWTTSSTDGLPIVPWNESSKRFDIERPQTCQFNAAKKGSYTVTVEVTNYDGSVVSASLDIAVNSVTTLTFVDYSTLLPIQGVKVLINSEYEGSTNEYGQVVFNDLPKALLYKIYAYRFMGLDGIVYNDINDFIELEYGSNNTIMMFNSDIDVYSVKMTATKEENGKTITTHDDIDIMSSAVSLSMSDKTVVFDLNITDNDDYGVKEYQLMQEGKVKATSKTNEFKKLSPSDFAQNSAVTLRLIRVGGDKVDVKLQLKFVKSGWDVSDDSNYGSITLGSGISITLPDVIPVVGGMNFNMDAGKLPFSVCATPQKLMIGMGLNKEIFGKGVLEDKTEKGFAQMEKNFDGIAALVDELADLAGEKNFQGIKDHLDLQKYLADKEDPPLPLLQDLEPDFKLVGTICYDFASQKMSYTLVFTMICDFEKALNVPPIGPVPIVVTISGEFSLKTSVKLGFDFDKLGFDFDNVINDLEYKKVLEVIFDHIFAELEVAFGLEFGLGAGVGVHKVASVTINGDVGLKGQMVFSTQYSKLTLTLDFSVRARLLAFEYRKDFFEKEWLLAEGSWSEDGKNASVYSLRNIASIPTNEYTLADRSYLDYTSDWYETQNVTLFASFGDRDYTTDTDTLMTYIYPDTLLQTVQTEDHKVMIWLTDDATRSSANRTKLVYSVYDELTCKWTTPQSVADDGTLDSYPYLATDGTSIWAAWVNMNAALTDDMNLDTGMLHSEICTAMFDPQTMSFRQVTALTANDVIDLNPKIAVSGDQIAAAWVSNDSGDLWGTSGTNTIYISIYENGSWSDVQAVKVLNSAVSNMEIGYVDDTLSVAYCLDTDNSFDTTDDIAVYVIVPGTEEEYLLSEDGLNSNIQYVTIAGEQHLTWYSDGYIRSISTFVGESQDLLNGVMVTGGYRIVSDINGTVILKTVPMDGYSELYVSVYDEDDDSWSNDIRLTYQNSAYINDFGAMVEENGDITVIYTSEIEDMAQMCSGTIGFVKDISLDSVSHNSSDAVPGQMTKLYADVTNHGIADVESVVFQMKKDGTVLCETNVPLALKAGATVSVEVPMTVPESVGITEYEVEIVLPDAEEIDLSNNIGTVEFGHGNLSLYVSDMYGENSRLLTLEVINNGGYAVEPVITIRKDTEDQTVVDVIELEELSGKSSAVVSYALKDLADSVYIELTSDREEYYTGDNVVYYSLESMPDSSVTGDVNGDGDINNTDTELLSQYFAGHPAEIVEGNADVDGDGLLTRRDAMILSRHLAGWDGYTLPYQQ